MVRLSVSVSGVVAGMMFMSATCRSPVEIDLGPTVTAADPGQTTSDTPLALVDVSVLSMSDSTLALSQSIFTRAGRIEWIGPSAQREPPPDALVIPGDGRIVMPALIDMHVHVLQEADLRAYAAHGVGTVRNMWGSAAVQRYATEIDHGTRFGPRIYSASPGLDAPPAQWPGTQFVTSPDDAAAVVQSQKAAGWTFLKVYTNLESAVFQAVMRSAREQGIPAVGHVPLAVDVRLALQEGIASIEHLSGYDRAVSRTRRSGTWGWSDADTSLFASLAVATHDAETWNCPTLAIYARLAEQHPPHERPRIIANRRLFIKALHAAGAGILAGTDAGIGTVAPGSSLHDELTELVASGLSPYEAIRAATSSAAAYLDRSDIGVLTAGARADLLLIRGDPRQDLTRLRALSGIVLAGAWTPERDLASRTAGSASR